MHSPAVHAVLIIGFVILVIAAVAFGGTDERLGEEIREQICKMQPTLIGCGGSPDQARPPI